MDKTERLYDVLGEMLYVVAMADGVIQAEERQALKKFLSNHAYKGEIEWSFFYEEKNNHNIDDVYKKVLDCCHSHGPSPIYVEFVEAMKTIANAVDGIDEKEEKFIQSFSADLLARFQRDAERLLKSKDDDL
jgi:uncharacterized tellurite resistance protein B-like protein